MERLDRMTSEEELFDSVFIGEEKNLSSEKIQETKESNKQILANIVTSVLTLQANARMEASKIFLTF